MSRIHSENMQAASLLGLVAFSVSRIARRIFFGVGFGLLGVAVVSCASRPPREAAYDFDASTASESNRPLVSWVVSPPADCAIGASGPTLNPRNAIRYARLAAIEALASVSLEVDVQTISGEGAQGSFEISAQALSGTLADARIVALWADTESAGEDRRRIRHVYALACWPDASLRALPRPAFPRWLIEPPAEPGRICATGIAGPTWKREDQHVRALQDARLALAIALESQIEKRIYDDGHGVAKMARQIEPSVSALRRAASAEQLDRDWFDEAGIGPVGLPGVLYGLACIED